MKLFKFQSENPFQLNMGGKNSLLQHAVTIISLFFLHNK